jgi:hypothetical protein
LVRQAFAHMPGVAGLEGTERIPSAALFQRIARSWQFVDLNAHGSSVLGPTSKSSEELLVVVCRETLPGIDPNYPDGRLQLVAVPGDADLRRGKGGTNAILLADQALPASDFSWSLFYSHHRSDDVLGKPWVEDLDQLQVDLNIALSKRWEVINRMAEAPIVAPGGAISEDMADLDGYSLLEIEPSLASWRPRVMEWPTQILAALDREVEERRQAIFTIGGYQAASRGEAPGSRTAYRAIVALQQADSTVHGPVNQRFQRSACDFARRCWRQMKAYGDVPMAIDITGDEYAHLAEPYIDSTKLSDRPPAYKLVNAFGPSPELRAQEILQLLPLRGADGEPFMRTEEARRQYPDRTVFDEAGDPRSVARRRAKTIASAIHTVTAQLREQTQFHEVDIAHPLIKQIGMQVFAIMEQRYPRKRDDDLNSHLATLSEITQDETADPVSRIAAEMRQNLYYEWQAMMAGQMAPAQETQQGAVAPTRPTIDRQGVARDMRGGNSPAQAAPQSAGQG